MAISSLGYVRIGMQEPESWADTGQNVLGFAQTSADDGSVRLRMDGAPFRFLVERAQQDGFLCAGWECEADAYEALVERLKGAGVSLREGSAEECAARSVAAFVAGRDPSGNDFELFQGRAGADGEFRSPVEGVRFVADALGLGHVVLPSAAHQETSRFYQDLLGFGMSDELTLPPFAEGAPPMCIHFLHARSPRHHSLGLFNGPAPSGVVHLMVELETLDAVGQCLDRVNAAGLSLTATLGRHCNDGMVSFYFLAPGGIPVEVGYDGLQFDWADFVPTKSTVGDLWGHAYSFPE
jgi:3,4-dihydroxy-9,10-secoandrosta-1,3,5(10)-triene-9,17-dione 4,5-dioxygenase